MILRHRQMRPKDVHECVEIIASFAFLARPGSLVSFREPLPLRHRSWLCGQLLRALVIFRRPQSRFKRVTTI